MTEVVSFPLLWKDDLTKMGTDLEAAYIKNNNISLSSTPMTKISHKILLPELKSYLSGMINVLLYDLSMNYQRREITCDGMCKITVNTGQISKENSLVMESYNGFLYLTTGENSVMASQVEIASASGGLVTVPSYARTSYGGMHWNTFH
jgi:hypothetical protein